MAAFAEVSLSSVGSACHSDVFSYDASYRYIYVLLMKEEVPELLTELLPDLLISARLPEDGQREPSATEVVACGLHHRVEAEVGPAITAVFHPPGVLLRPARLRLRFLYAFSRLGHLVYSSRLHHYFANNSHALLRVAKEHLLREAYHPPTRLPEEFVAPSILILSISIYIMRRMT